MFCFGEARVSCRRRRGLAEGQVGEQKESHPQTEQSSDVFTYGQVFKLHELKHVIAIGSSAADLAVHTGVLKVSAIKLKPG